MEKDVSKKNRLSWVDGCKGLAIIVVVLYHVTMGLSEAGILQNNTFLEYFWVYATATATPVFFILSGFFIERSVSKSGHMGYLKTSLHYVLFPYLLWSLIQWAMKLAFASYVNTNVAPDPTFLLNAPIGQFWFLHALFFAQIVYILLHKYHNKHYVPVAAAFMAIAFLLSPYQTLSEDLRAVSFVLLGAFARRAQLQDKITGINWTVISIATLIFSGPLYDNVMIPAGFQNTSNFLGGIAATILLAAAFMKWEAPVSLQVLGKYSMYIFVLHIMFLVPFRIALMKAGLISPAITIPVCTLIGLTLPIIFAIIVEYLGITAYMGIKSVAYFKIPRPENKKPLGSL